jgi:hypothetical protein
VLRPCPEEPGGGDPATRAKCAPGPSTGMAGNFPGHPRPRFYSAPPFPVLCVRACGQRDHPLYLPVRAVDPRTVRTRAASVHEAIVSRIGVLFCMASRRVSAGVIDRGPAPCSRKHVCSCREKTRRPCRIPLAYVAHFFLRTLLCGELTRWRPPRRFEVGLGGDAPRQTVLGDFSRNTNGKGNNFTHSGENKGKYRAALKKLTSSKYPMDMRYTIPRHGCAF